MTSLYITMFLAGMLTILLPCILPLVPIVLGVSISGRSKLRPLFTIAGMLVSFVGFTFLLSVVLNQFVELADYIRISTYYILVLFGFGFMTKNKTIQLLGAVLGGFFFWDKGWIAMTIAQTIGATLMEVGGKVATALQQWGTDIQQKASSELGRENPFTAFIIGLTMGLVWVPCAGPALGFAFAFVREQPGLEAALLLGTYGLGTAVPLLLIGYGGQAAAHSSRALAKYSGKIKQVSGVILIVSGLALNYHWFRAIEIYLVSNTSFGNLGVELEKKLIGEEVVWPGEQEQEKEEPKDVIDSPSAMKLPTLPKITRAPELASEGPWHNSEPLTLESLRGKVVLIDFWTYSCINCIRTLPYLKQWSDTFADAPFEIIGVHAPEFVFEKSERNVKAAIANHGLTYPVVQDNDFETWRAFANRYWPAKYLIDADGYIRYTHFGEGAYEETELAIKSLLQEAGHAAEEGIHAQDNQRARREQSPEIYLGSRSWPAFQNGPANPTNEVLSLKGDEIVQLHKYSLSGDWQMMDDERQVLRSEEGWLRLKFVGSEVNMVLGCEGDGHKRDQCGVYPEVDGEKVNPVAVGFTDSYNLWRGEYGEHELFFKTQKGLNAYAFTFGS